MRTHKKEKNEIVRNGETGKIGGTVYRVVLTGGPCAGKVSPTH